MLGDCYLNLHSRHVQQYKVAPPPDQNLFWVPTTQWFLTIPENQVGIQG